MFDPVPSISSAAVVAFMFFMMSRARAGQPTVDVARGEVCFRHGILMKALGLIACVGVPLFCIVFVFFKPPDSAEDWYAFWGLLIGFPLLGLPLAWESFRYALLVRDRGLECRSPWRGRQFIPWDELQEVSYCAMNMWFVLHATDGYKFRIHMYVPGVKTLIEMLLGHVPSAAFERAIPGMRLLGITHDPLD
jgi:hypothetical protein